MNTVVLGDEMSIWSLLFGKKKQPVDWYWTYYGKGAYAYRIGVAKDQCPVTYGVNEYWAWMDGWNEMHQLVEKSRKGKI